MRQDRITGFDVAFRKSEKHKIKFGIVYPDSIIDIEDAEIDELQVKIKAFLDFHIAIKPNDASVILFDIDSRIDIGSPIWNIDLKGKRLYHLPERLYGNLDELVQETPFIASHNILIDIINNQKTFASIFNILPTIYTNRGLIALGLYNENPETEV